MEITNQPEIRATAKELLRLDGLKASNSSELAANDKALTDFCRDAAPALARAVLRIYQPECELEPEYEQKRRRLFEWACLEQGQKDREHLAAKDARIAHLQKCLDIAARDLSEYVAGEGEVQEYERRLREKDANLKLATDALEDINTTRWSQADSESDPITIIADKALAGTREGL